MCYNWNAMWAGAKEGTNKGKQKWRMGELLRMTGAARWIDFMPSAHSGKTVAPVEENR